jgi:hypothetical protein
MREFERIFDDDIDCHDTNRGSFIHTGRDDDEFMKEFFGINDSINDSIHDPFRLDARFGTPNQNGFARDRIDRPEFYQRQSNPAFYQNNNTFNNQAPQQVNTG